MTCAPRAISTLHLSLLLFVAGRMPVRHYPATWTSDAGRQRRMVDVRLDAVGFNACDPNRGRR
jgi:hypothetical protein